MSKSVKISETIMRKLNQREKLMVKILAVCAVGILTFWIGSKWLGHWGEVKKSLADLEAKLKVIDVKEAKQAGLMSIVPVFEMPEEEDKQKFLFRDKLDEQLKKVGIKSEPLTELAIRKSRQAGYRLLRFKCTAKCRFTQVLDLLANLKENPYLVGIEEMRIECDPKKPQEVELNLTVSTFVK